MGPEKNESLWNGKMEYILLQYKKTLSDAHFYDKLKSLNAVI